MHMASDAGAVAVAGADECSNSPLPAIAICGDSSGSDSGCIGATSSLSSQMPGTNVRF